MHRIQGLTIEKGEREKSWMALRSLDWMTAYLKVPFAELGDIEGEAGVWVRDTSSVYLYFTKGSIGHLGGIVQQTTGLELSGKIRTGARDFRVFST